ncbi:hypothetical protein [Myxococcus sp. RHSTA-1-4]|uniref:hypothetical protein n=1 Tax=Myxococcus sp. RHSTA-1-4 TaxID=2874601 RepID=UPI001CBC2CBE|nr:hypothetical protein [Myxococcus sp. RHSTA-1-4]MBZ4422608.1 hypothetical protein [Myxococcus sp. RHSTA-1-4]
MAMSLDTLTVETLAETPLVDVAELLVARKPAAFRERLLAVDMAELTEMPDDIAQAYGWRAPEELATWRAIELALDLDEDTEGFWKSGGLSLGLDLYPDALSPSDEELDEGSFLPPGAEVLFAGLFRLCEHASGDRTLVSLLPDPLGLLRVHSYSHDTGRLGRPRSLKSFVLNTWLSEMDPGEGPRRPGQVGIARFKQLVRMAEAFDERLESVRRDQQPPAFRDSAKLHARSRWLIDLLWGTPSVSLAEELTQAPGLEDWEAEKPLLLEQPQFANYWMVAHYFLGNDAACDEAVEQGAQARPDPTRWLAQLVRRQRDNPGTARIGRTGPRELAELRRQVRAAARPSQLAGR